MINLIPEPHVIEIFGEFLNCVLSLCYVVINHFKIAREYKLIYIVSKQEQFIWSVKMLMKKMVTC